MTKKESVDNIIYDLRLSGSADFEADDRSFTVNLLEGSKGEYKIEEGAENVTLKGLTAVRKHISGLGKNILWM